MVVTSYNDGKIYFKCNECGINDVYDASSKLSDNCAVSVEVVCKKCGNSVEVCILICRDQTKAQLLQSKFNLLRNT